MHAHPVPISRRRLLQLGAAASAAGLAACAAPLPSLTPLATPGGASTSPGEPTRPATPTPTPSPNPTAVPQTGAVLYRDGAMADGRADSLQRHVSILVVDGRIAWIRPRDGEEDASGASIVDCAGATFVPGLVDCHAHVTGPGGANWIERFNDPPEVLLATAEHNARIGLAAGVRWMRDVGSPIGVDPSDGRERALALAVRDRWAGRADRPYLRAAGSWLFAAGVAPMRAAVSVQAANADELVAAAVRQLEDGADLVKLYMDGPDANVSPWTATEVTRVVDAAHERGARVAAHSGRLNGAREAVLGGVDSIEHGFDLDASVATEMAARGTTLVSTLSVMRSWLSFGTTTTLERFASPDGRAAVEARLEQGEASVRAARAAGVAIATGSDFGGGSLRANQLAWEVTSLVAAGLEPVDALAAATWRGGELLAIEGAGTIREGEPADFFLVHGDPLSDPESLWRVWRTGWEA